MEGNKKHTAVLKVNYAPIEQYADVSDLREGPWTDIYALAAVVHGCICNEAPLPATFRVVRDRLPPMAKIAKTTNTHFGQSYSSSFIKAIDHALAVQPGDRPQSVEIFAKELKLRSVSQPQRFDWRTALGDRVSLLANGSGAASVAFGASSTVADTVPFANAQSAEANVSPPIKSVNPITPTVPRSGTKWQLFGGGLAVVLVAAALTWSMRGPTQAPNPAVPMAKASAPAEILPSSAPFPVVANSAPASELVPLTVVSEPIASPVARVQQRPANTARSALTTTKPQDQHRAGVQEAAAAPPPKSDSKEASRVVEAPKPKREAPVLCPDSNLFTRPMCIYRECQQPEFKNLQVCIEDRKRWEERDKQNRP